ncbi:MAG: DNA-directed RNA polymerase subunit alpha [Planctomycetota bacterium]|jgi:DNA-directed RNA polymerase subunit alpha
MRIRWRGFELPTRLIVDRETLTSSYGKFIAEPFERGYGHTIGNALRRVLLSSLKGAAVTWVKIDGVSHEFTAIEGVREDVTEIVLNLKRLLVKLDADEEQRLVIEKSGAGPVLASDIKVNEKVEIVNPDLQICEITGSATFNAELGVGRGRGYHAAEDIGSEHELDLGTIPIDAAFSPVRRVRYSTENARVGQRTDYDRLTIEVWTDGTISPEDALAEAGMILRKHLNPFVKYFELGKEIPQAEIVRAQIETPEEARRRELREKLGQSVSILDPSVRAANCLEVEGIKTIGELVSRAEPDMLKIKNFGKTSLRELKKKLADMNLSFGMQVEVS